MDRSIDPNTWYNDRELAFTPKHFIVSKTELTIESKMWILNNLRGRFSTVVRYDDQIAPLLVVNYLDGVPAFEDPKEAVLYELTWG